MGFSIVVPLLKMVGMLKIILGLTRFPVRVVLDENRRLALVLSYVASYQMLDIYVAMLFATYFNSDSSDAVVLPGFYWFFSYCIVSLLVSGLLEGLLVEDFRYWPDVDRSGRYQNADGSDDEPFESELEHVHTRPHDLSV